LGLAFVIRLLPFRVLKSSGSQWRNQRPGISEKDERSFWAEPPQKHATLFTHAPAGRKGGVAGWVKWWKGDLSGSVGSNDNKAADDFRVLTTDC